MNAAIGTNIAAIDYINFWAFRLTLGRGLITILIIESETNQRIQFSGLAQQVESIVDLFLGHEIRIRVVSYQFFRRYFRINSANMLIKTVLLGMHKVQEWIWLLL